ncbi:MAG: hypothetical protein QOE39_1524 [Bradyrhizobium sp.]|jgi:hypothetical protein|nr:hypothetical protein [Bradyrhizobium sp.]
MSDGAGDVNGRRGPRYSRPIDLHFGQEPVPESGDFGAACIGFAADKVIAFRRSHDERIDRRKAARIEILLDQLDVPHGDAESVDGGLIGERGIAECQSLAKFAGSDVRGVEPYSPIVRPFHRMQERAIEQVAWLSQGGNSLEMRGAADRKQLDWKQCVVANA